MKSNDDKNRSYRRELFYGVILVVFGIGLCEDLENILKVGFRYV